MQLHNHSMHYCIPSVSYTHSDLNHAAHVDNYAGKDSERENSVRNIRFYIAVVERIHSLVISQLRGRMHFLTVILSQKRAHLSGAKLYVGNYRKACGDKVIC